MTPNCTNCGGHVSHSYARSVARPDENPVDCCPNCDDIIRRGGKIVKARATREGNPSDRTKYDPEKGGGSLNV